MCYDKFMDVMISHGYETHGLNESWKCDDCRKLKIQFEKFMQTNAYKEMMKEIEQDMA